MDDERTGLQTMGKFPQTQFNHSFIDFSGWMANVNRSIAKPLFDGLISYSKGSYGEAVDHLLPIRYELVQSS